MTTWVPCLRCSPCASDALRNNCRTLRPSLVAEQQEVIDLLHATVSAQRRIVASLRPVLLDSFGLAVALRNHVEDWSRNSGVPVELELPSDLPAASSRGCADAVSHHAGVVDQRRQARARVTGASVAACRG